jgi:hypothetical protein
MAAVEMDIASRGNAFVLKKKEAVHMLVRTVARYVTSISGFYPQADYSLGKNA